MNDVAKMMAELTDYSRKLAIASNEYTDACRDAANRRTDYDVQWAQGLLRASGGTVSERQASTTLVCKDAMREARIAEAMRDALKERIRALESVLNATQTRARFLEGEMKLGDRYQ